MLAIPEPKLHARGAHYSDALTRARMAPRLAAPAAPEPLQDVHVPTWLLDLPRHEAPSLATLRRLTREIVALLERGELEGIDRLLALSHTTTLHPELQATLLRLTFTARASLPSWPQRLHTTHERLTALGLDAGDYLSGLEP